MGLILGLGEATRISAPATDAVIYWQANLDRLYGGLTAIGQPAYLYPPPLGMFLAILHPIGWDLFIVLWMTLLCWCLWYVARGWSAIVAIGGVVGILLGPSPLSVVASAILLGNVWLLMTAAIVIGFRYPVAWSVVLLTKIGPGVGLLWFAARGEWRQLGIALGSTALIAALTIVLRPDLWSSWIGMMVASSSMPSLIPLVGVPFAARVLMSAALIIWGARTDRRWTVLVAAGWAVPALYPWFFLPIWIGVLRVSEPSRLMRAVRTRAVRALRDGRIPALDRRDSRKMALRATYIARASLTPGHDRP